MPYQTTALASIPNLENMEGQGPVQAALTQALRTRRIPSSLLFVGLPHVGKRTTALSFALTLNCLQSQNNQPFCSQCTACHKILAGVHPDVAIVSPEGRFVKIEQMRALIARFHRPAYEAKKRVIIFSKAERMNVQTANAFLKTLEEPPKDSVLILCASAPRLLPSTIVSRCAMLQFSPLKGAMVKDHLQRKFPDEPSEVLEFAVRFGQGSLRWDLVEEAHVLMPLRLAWIALLKHPKSAPLTDGMQVCSQAATTQAWAFVLAWLETWLRDASLLLTMPPAARVKHAKKALLNHDFLPELTQFAHCYQADALAHLWREVLGARREINDWNVNKALRLQTLLLSFRQMSQ